ncbi:MAG: hypothetical protein Q4A27_03095 [bacterium]|nr:hypothetical protein [bacterium]
MSIKKRWAEICLDWRRYGGEYLGVIFVLILVASIGWLAGIKPIFDGIHREKLNELKTEIIRNFSENESVLSFPNSEQAQKAKQNLEEIAQKDAISFEKIEIIKIEKGEKFEVVIHFKGAK